MEHVNMNVS